MAQRQAVEPVAHVASADQQAKQSVKSVGDMAETKGRYGASYMRIAASATASPLMSAPVLAKATASTRRVKLWSSCEEDA